MITLLILLVRRRVVQRLHMFRGGILRQSNYDPVTLRCVWAGNSVSFR